MRTHSQSHNSNRQQQVNPTFLEPFNLVEPIPVVTMDDNRTMAQLLEAPIVGYEDAIVVPEITADNFELKHGLLTLVQNKQFFGHDKQDPHAHIRYFNKITSTMKFPNVPSTSVKLMLFPFSLEGSAQIWLEKDPPRSILTLYDLVSKFINNFFPPSKTTNLRNEITRFQQRFDETFYEAWDRFNDLLRACPHHGFSKLHQLDTFYNALNSNDQDSLNSAASGNFLDKMPHDCLRIIESKSKVRNSLNKPVVAKVSSSSSTLGISPDVNKGLLFVTTAKGKDTCLNNALNQKGNGMTHDALAESNVVNCSKTKITSDSNIIPYSQYVIESQQAAIHNYESSAQQDALILSMIEQLKTQKAQQLEPKLYDGNVIKNTSATVIPDSEETLMLAEESRSKMLLKQKDPMMLEKKVNTTPGDYANSVNSLEPTLSSRPTKVEVPKELPKVSMVNTSLKKLKHHLVGFDVVVKEKTTATAITKGSWGFEHTKACFRDKIIPFVKALKDLFNTFDQYLIDKLSEVQNIFHQMEQAVEQHRLESKTFKVKMNQVLNENERLLEQVINKDIVNIIMNSSMDIASEIFQRDNFVSNQNAPSFDQLLELIELKAQSQEKDTVIKKLKERIKSLSGKMNEDKIKKDLEEIETINIELDHRSVEISDLNASLQEKVLVITALKDDLRKLKGKALVEPITHKLLNKKTAHSAYIKHTQEEATVLRDLVEHVKSKYLLDQSLESACRYAKRIQELHTNISKTCSSINNADGKLVAVTPKKKDKRVKFTKPVTSSGNTNTKTSSSSNLVFNKPMLSSTGLKPSTSASRSQPSGNTKKDKILQTPSSTQKNKVKAHPRKVKSSLKNKDCVVEPKETAHVQHSKLNDNSELKCVKCNGCMLSDNHDLCVLDFINNVIARTKSKSVKKNSKRKVWKPTGKVFTNIRYIWRPTSRSFTIVANAYPLTRITTTTEVPLRKPTALNNETPKLVITLVYSRKPRKSKTNVSVSKSKVIQIVLWYLNSGCSKHMTGDRSQLTNFVNKFVGTVKFKNDHVEKILGYKGVDILTGSRDNNLYTLSLGDMMASSPICLLSKASKTKSWLWN
ncbi:integrase, catalytic region, zinc finger, CCHC-type containing protein [Tanacetum coccineum]